MSHTPTAEQVAALDVFAAGEALVIQAGAGTGKTSTLEMMARATDRRGQYVAFNRSIVDDAARRFPPNCSARTMHSLAYRAVVDRQMAGRLKAPRLRSDLLARLIGVKAHNVSFGTQTKVLQPGFLAGHVMRAIDNFCDSDDDLPDARHVGYIDGIDLPKEDGTRTWENNDAVRAVLEPHLAAAWRDLTSAGGRLPLRHGHYLKMWERADPRIDAEYLVVDEAQDMNPVMVSIVESQLERAQLVAVGDSCQSIYGWRGAVDALDRFEVDATLYLTQSFRFGHDIAAVANAILGRLDAVLRLKGLDAIAGSVAEVPAPAAVLTRTNAYAVRQLFDEQRAGRSAHLIGGGAEVQRFVKAAIELRDKGRTGHHELACFTSWDEVVSYVAFDPAGDELALMVKMIEEYGADEINAALSAMPADEARADTVISTAHKAKGREWDSVRLTADFKYPEGADDLAEEEWRLLYVACTRAKHALDVTASAPMCDLLGIDRVEEKVA